MNGASFRYLLTNTPHQRGEYISATRTSHTFNSLLSGTSYNISVATVGAIDFESEKVQINMVTTSKGFISVPMQRASTGIFPFHLYCLVTLTSLFETIRTVQSEVSYGFYAGGKHQRHVGQT